MMYSQTHFGRSRVFFAVRLKLVFPLGKEMHFDSLEVGFPRTEGARSECTE